MRIDLADAPQEPDRLAVAVDRLFGRPEGAIPVVEFALALDIVKVDLTETDGFEGMLLTDDVRSWGGIIANASKGPLRARFTVAHELGHFLIERHVATASEGFACRAFDMRESRKRSRHQVQETEANRFAISLLAPPRLARSWVEAEPDLSAARGLAAALEISRQAAMIRYVELHDEPLAAVFSACGAVTGISRGARFPWIKLKRGDRLGAMTQAGRVVARGEPGRTRMTEAMAVAWLSDPDVELFEQTRVSPKGNGTTLLWATPPDVSDDEDPERPPLSMPGFRR